MAFSAAPTPLYGLYQEQDRLPTWVVTIVFAAYAAGVVISLFLAGHVSDWIGRRRVLIPAVLTSTLASILFIVCPSLTGLLVARVLSGFAVGGIMATATSCLAELHLVSRPGAHPRRAEMVATAANLGGIGLGPLVSGIIADRTDRPLVLPYLIFAILLVLAAIGLSMVPETAPLPECKPRYRAQRISVPPESQGLYIAAAAVSFAALAIFGLFTSLAPTLINGMIDHPSHTLTGAVAFSALAAGAIGQIVLAHASARSLLITGLLFVLVGLGVLTTAVTTGSTAWFVVGGVIAGAGAGMSFKSSLTIVAVLADPRHRAEALAGIFLAGYIGLALPIVGLGIATHFVSARLALVGFAVVLAAITAIGGLSAQRRLPQQPANT